MLSPKPWPHSSQLTLPSDEGSNFPYWGRNNFPQYEGSASKTLSQMLLKPNEQNRYLGLLFCTTKQLIKSFFKKSFGCYLSAPIIDLQHFNPEVVYGFVNSKDKGHSQLVIISKPS